jgi:hypothetical protein
VLDEKKDGLKVVKMALMWGIMSVSLKVDWREDLPVVLKVEAMVEWKARLRAGQMVVYWVTKTVL